MSASRGAQVGRGDGNGRRAALGVELDARRSDAAAVVQNMSCKSAACAPASNSPSRDTHAGFFQRHVQSDKGVHGCSPMVLRGRFYRFKGEPPRLPHVRIGDWSRGAAGDKWDLPYGTSVMAAALLMDDDLCLNDPPPLPCRPVRSRHA